MKLSPHNENPVAIIQEEARSVARCFGVAAADAAAASLIERILFRLGGTTVYVPKQSADNRKRIHEEIRAAFNGRNLFELAHAYHMTPRHVRRIIAPQLGKNPKQA